MYYKITNKNCDVYKKLHEMRTKELQMEEDNRKLISEKTGLSWEKFFGHGGQQNFGRVTEYTGFVFSEPEKVDLNIWKRHPEFNDVFIPNKKTKKGRDMAEFLLNGLKGNWFSIVYDCLGVEHPNGKFTFPFVQICGEVIVLYLDDKTQLDNEDIIEITSKEANQLLDC